MDQTDTTMAAWTARVCHELGLDPAVLDTPALLDITRDVAHTVARAAAPLTAYLIGVAVGRGTPWADATATVADLIQSEHP